MQPRSGDAATYGPQKAARSVSETGPCLQGLLLWGPSGPSGGAGLGPGSQEQLGPNTARPQASAPSEASGPARRRLRLGRGASPAASSASPSVAAILTRAGAASGPLCGVGARPLKVHVHLGPCDVTSLGNGAVVDTAIKMGSCWRGGPGEKRRRHTGARPPPSPRRWSRNQRRLHEPGTHRSPEARRGAWGRGSRAASEGTSPAHTWPLGSGPAEWERVGGRGASRPVCGAWARPASAAEAAGADACVARRLCLA